MNLDQQTHEGGHDSKPLFNWILVRFLLVATYFLASACKVLYAAQQQHRLATTGPYKRVRHPRYMGFILIMTGLLFQWPTLLTLAMYPILVVTYVYLALREEREARVEFGDAYKRYAANTPGYFPSFAVHAHAA